MTPGLSLGPHPLNPFALVASPKLGLRQNVIQNTKTKQEEKYLKPLKHNQEEVFETFETKPKKTFETIEMNLGPLR